MKKALITGVTGQDGSYLAELLLAKGYVVTGLDRRKSVPNDNNIAHIRDKIKIELGDLNDACSIDRVVSQGFDEIYGLAAQSHVGVSFEQPFFTFQTNAVSVLHFLESIRNHSPKTKYYFAATSEMFGGVTGGPYNEETEFYPRSPYGVAKLAAFWLVKNYRESYGLQCCSGILFNHESRRRGGQFVTKKICDWVKEIIAMAKGDFSKDNLAQIIHLHGELLLGNLEARRDWGFAPDYCEGMYRILNQNEIKGKNEDTSMDDYVLGTGVTRSVRDFIEIAFKKGLKLELEWRRGDLLCKREGESRSYVEEIGMVKGTNAIAIRTDEKFHRPSEVDVLIADPIKARRELRWIPQHSFEDLVDDMLS